MSFLQPWMLFALPVMALPIIIHLINQRRFQSVPWGAMQFLLTANRMSRGYARLRRWLILLMRTLAIAGLIFAISRPLASGLVGAAAGRAADVAVVLVDRSPSMQQRGLESAASKLRTARRQLDQALQTLGAQRVVLIDSVSPEPRELVAGETLVEIPDAGPSDAAADIPGMLLRALDYLQTNQVAQADIWIGSDLRSLDWKPADGRWDSIRRGFNQYANRVRFHLLAYPEVAAENRAVRVTAVTREAGGGGAGGGAAVVIDLEITAENRSDDAPGETIPVEFEIDGARSVLEVELAGPKLQLRGHRIPITGVAEQGWGRVSIPGDANPADDVSYFVFADRPPRRAIVLSGDPEVRRPLQLAAGIAPAPDQAVEAIAVAGNSLEEAAWNELALVLWHGNLPRGADLDALAAWVDRGGRVIFFPPAEPDRASAFGIRWGEWSNREQPLAVSSWRGDSDLLRATQSGQALPVGQLRVRRHVGLEGDATPLASLGENEPLLVRAATPRGGVYFCATTPRPDDSSLAADGVVLYIAVQRAGMAGAEALQSTGSFVAGEVSSEAAQQWKAIRVGEQALSLEYASTAGIYQGEAGLIAINRPPREDQPAVLSDGQLDRLFADLPLDRVNEAAGSLSALVREIWRLFLVAMMIALLVEAALCVPRISLGGVTRP